MSTVFTIIAVLFIIAIWVARNDAALRRKRDERLKMLAEEQCECCGLPTCSNPEPQ